MEIKNYKISDTYHKKIVLLSDIHYFDKSMSYKLNQITNTIKKIKPDYICICGDLVDDLNIKDKFGLINWIKELAKISLVLIAIGNHEYQLNRKLVDYYDKKLFNKLSKINNVKVLDNDYINIDKINFIGLNLPYQYYKNKEDETELINFVNNNFAKLNKGYNILLCHSPYMIARKNVLDKLKCKNDISLILCGHMHAGLTFNWMKKIFKGRGLITPQKRILGKYCYGIYNYNDINVIISSGITKLSKSHYLKMFNRFYKSEIVIIEI